MSDKRLQFADKITLDRIDKLHPKIRNQVREDYLTINFRLPHGIRLRFSSSLSVTWLMLGINLKFRIS